MSRQIIFTSVDLCKESGGHCTVGTNFNGTARAINITLSDAPPTEEQIVEALRVMARVMILQLADKSTTGLRASLLPKVVDLTV